MSDYQSITVQQAPTGAQPPVPDIDAQAAAAIEGASPPQSPPALPSDQQSVPEPEQTPEQKQEQEIIEAARIDVEAIEAAWLESGTIPEAELAKLESVGISKELAEDYINYRQGQAEAVLNEMVAEVGGAEHLSKMQQWAASSWGSEQLEAYNRAVESDDKGQMQLALRALRADYERANGSKGRLVMAAIRPAAVSNNVYHSMEELVRDQSHPLYAQDPAYRERVMAKLARSNL